ARSLIGTIDFKPGPAPAAAAGETCRLSDATWASARVGWNKPMADRLPGDAVLLRAGGRLFARGLYAYAPSAYRYDLGGTWTKLTAKAGIADGSDGSVVFVVLGDDKELYRSPKLRADELADVAVDVGGVKTLELRVENAGDGNAGDRAAWLEPTVTRGPAR
ncbi:MAG: hypothetical protein JWO31_2908, partial [Phycisphaerales bacterium]|nr:hypothetical protein [Phycisphaerales bacterium]